MINALNSNPATSSLLRRKLALHASGPRIDVTAARAACRLIEPRLPAPTLLECMTPTSARLSSPSLFCDPTNPGLQDYPELLFSERRNLAPGDFPQEWLEAYLHWAQKLRLGQESELHYEKCRRAVADHAIRDDLVPEHPAVAGALLYLLSQAPTLPLRRALMKRALGSAIGAYAAGQGLLVPEEQESVVQALKADSRLLFWTSRIPGLQKTCARLATRHHDLWGALTLLLADSPDEKLRRWLETLALAACESPAAACAALVLQPQMEPSVRALWLATFRQKPAARDILATARFAKYTSPDWARLADQLRPQATADQGQLWCNWFLLVEPERAQSELNTNPTADPLWSVELIGKLNLQADDFCDRMAEKLTTSLWRQEAMVVLDWLNFRKARRSSNGTTV